MRWSWLCVVATGCGFSSTPAGNHDGPSDAAIDGAADSGVIDGGTTAQGCFAQWRNGPLKLEMPAVLTNQHAAGADERDPWISKDGLELYYTYQPIGGDDADIYRATRGAVTDDFGTGSALDEISESNGESRASLTADGKVIAFASDRANGTFQLYQATRSDPAADFANVSTGPMTALNMPAGGKYDPFLSADGLELYYAPSPQIGQQHISRAIRATTTASFGAPQPVMELNAITGQDADPALSADRRIVVFSSTRPAGPGLGLTNLWYATRMSTSDPWDAPKLVPTVNTDSMDGDPALSEDDCTLYFSSQRAGTGTYDLYQVAVGQPGS